MSRHLLVTGGAGFVGSSLAIELKARHPDWHFVALDNLRRRGSELALSRLRANGIDFLHGDVRIPADLEAAGACDLILECSAEPSVLAGLDGSPAYVLASNLDGTIHCLEKARRHGAGMIFLSTSRVYPIGGLSSIPLLETDSRFEIAAVSRPGLSSHGVAEDFALEGPRSIYGATKLASELLIAEYVDAYRLPIVIDRCGVIAGPWQMGKVDQGVIVHWVASHLYGRPLSYVGFGGQGKQVRDLLHPLDLADLVDIQIARLADLAGRTYNVGGGREVSLSLRELTDVTARVSGQRIPIGSVPETRAADVPLYLSDCRRVEAELGWRPRRSAAAIVEECVRWMSDRREELRPIFAPDRRA